MGIAILLLCMVFVVIALARFEGLFDSAKTAQPVKRRAAFKARYRLNVKQPIAEFEEKMLVGMSREHNEVWVAAFCNDREVLRVTANVGSRYKSRATDNVNNWPTVARQVGASQIRQYHSHPPGFGASWFSPQDKEMYSSYKLFLAQHGIQFRAYLVYPRFFGFDYCIRPFSGE